LTSPSLDFLQSVVVFDDRAYVPDPNFTEEEATNLDLLGSPSPGDITPDSSGQDEDPGKFDTQEVVRGFADKGMSCAVLAPSGNALGDTRRFLSLTRRADVVILDWLIGQGVESRDGEILPASQHRTSLQLLLEVLERDKAVGSRLRLMCVYTGVRDLMDVENTIFLALAKDFPDARIDPKLGRIDVGDARIVFFSKPPVTGPALPGAVPAKDLPDRVVKEFGDFAASGLLPKLALQSLSAVRDQAHRILRRFTSKLDPALLAHRAMTNPEDTEEFVVELIGDELTAVVSNGFVTSLLSDLEVEKYVTEQIQDGEDRFYWNGRASDLPAQKLTASLARSVLIEGTDSKRKFKRTTSLSSLSLRGNEIDVRHASKEIDLEFAMLSSLSRDGSLDGEQTNAPELRLGTLLRLSASTAAVRFGKTGRALKPLASSKHRYYFCLQPICDSTRLEGPTAFPLLPLEIASVDGDQLGLVVKSDSFEVLSHKFKLGLVESSVFLPDAATETVIAEWIDGAWRFRGRKNTYDWLGNVRLNKAHRMANFLATDMGRVGINEYEYFRRAHE
jgi:hypothetical protein